MRCCGQMKRTVSKILKLISKSLFRTYGSSKTLLHYSGGCLALESDCLAMLVAWVRCSNCRLRGVWSRDSLSFGNSVMS